MTESAQNPEPAPHGASGKGRVTLASALLLSFLLHALGALPVIFAEATPDIGLESEWIGRFAQLEGIGHGSSDFDPAQETNWDEPVMHGSLVQPPPEPEPEVTDERPEDVQPPPEPSTEPDEAPEPEPEPQAAHAPSPDTGPARADEEAPADDNNNEAEQIDDVPQKVDSPPAPSEAPAVPGIDRSSPSNLPDMRHYGPGNARMTALVRLDRLRGAPYQRQASQLIQAVPDYRILLETTGLDPITELDAIFMASANPNHLHETFLAVRHRYDDRELRDVLDARFAQPPAWSEGRRPSRALVSEAGRYRDPRQVVLAARGLALVGKPAWFGHFDAPIAADSELAAGEELAENFRLLDGLRRIEEVAEEQNTIALISAYGLVYYAPGIGTLPRFEAVRLSLTHPSNPRLTIDLRFGSQAQAASFHASCPSLQRRIIGGIPGARMFGIASLIERLECAHSEDYVTVTGQYTSRELTTVLQFATPFIPRPPALTGLPEPPPPPAPSGSPAGAPDADDDSGDGDISGATGDNDAGDALSSQDAATR